MMHLLTSIFIRGMRLRGAGEGCEPFANEFDSHISPQSRIIMRLYIAVLDDVPDFIVPTLVAHTILNAHRFFEEISSAEYKYWLANSFKKCVIRVNKKEFTKIADIPFTYTGYENTTLGGIKSCAIPVPRKNEELPNVLKFAKLWKPTCS